MSSQKVSFPNTNIAGITIAGILHFPPDFDTKKKYPAIVAVHPGGGVKEQTAGLYSKKLAAHGFVALPYDASYQGESTGSPHGLENPYVRTEDISAVIDYLLTLDYVDPDKIAVLGICAGGGYSANAAINDKRIKALGTISGVNIGEMYRRGWHKDETKPLNAVPFQEQGSQARTNDVKEHKFDQFPLAPLRREDAPNEELAQAWDYYRTPRAQVNTTNGSFPQRSLTQLVSYDAFHFAEYYLTQPVLAIAGSKAGTAWYSEDLVKRAVSKDKKHYSVEGSNHIEMYDVEKYVDDAVSQLAPFYKRTIG